MLYNGSNETPPLGSYHGIPVNKRTLLDSAYEAQEQSAAASERDDMGLKDVAASLLHRSWSGGKMEFNTERSSRPGKDAVQVHKSATGEVQVVVTTKDAAAALKAMQGSGARSRLGHSRTSSGASSQAAKVLADCKQIRDTATGAAIMPAYDEENGQEDDRWVGDGLFSVSMHHRCRAFNARVEPLELMVQLDLVPQPLPGGEHMPHAASPSHLDPRQSSVLQMEDAPPGFQNGKYNVWSNAAHGYQQAGGVPSSRHSVPSDRGHGVLEVDGAQEH